MRKFAELSITILLFPPMSRGKRDVPVWVLAGSGIGCNAGGRRQKNSVTFALGLVFEGALEMFFEGCGKTGRAFVSGKFRDKKDWTVGSREKPCCAPQTKMENEIGWCRVMELPDPAQKSGDGHVQF